MILSVIWLEVLSHTVRLESGYALDGITNGTIIMEGGYKVLNHDEVLEILKNSL